MVLLKQALIWFLARPAAQALLLDTLEAVAKRTDNTVDDKVVAALRYGLQGKESPTETAIKDCGLACQVAGAVGNVASAASTVASAVKTVKDAVK